MPILRWLPRQFLPLLLFATTLSCSLPLSLFLGRMEDVFFSRWSPGWTPDETHFSGFYSARNSNDSSLQPFSLRPFFPINWQWRAVGICRYHYFSSDSYRVLRFMAIIKACVLKSETISLSWSSLVSIGTCIGQYWSVLAPALVSIGRY